MDTRHWPGHLSVTRPNRGRLTRQLRTEGTRPAIQEGSSICTKHSICFHTFKITTKARPGYDRVGRVRLAQATPDEGRLGLGAV